MCDKAGDKKRSQGGVELVFVRTFKFRLYPKRKQGEELELMLKHSCDVYNALLAERYEHGLSRYNLQNETLRDLKICNPTLKKIHSQVLQQLPLRVDRAFQAYYKRLSAGICPAGKPRYKKTQHFSSLTYPQSGFKIEGGKIVLSKVGKMKLVQHRTFEGKIKTLTIIKERSEQWYACFTTEQKQTRTKHPHANRTVGIDVGLTNLIATSEGMLVPSERFLRKSERKIAHTQRVLSKKKRGSKNRLKVKKKLAQAHHKIKNQRSDFLHKISRNLVNDYGMIIAEDLQIKNMMRNHRLAKSIGDASWAKLFEMIRYKAESAGSTFIKVDPNGTSQTCAQCHVRVPKKLKDRTHTCQACGYTQDRDVNAALNVQYRGNHGNTSLNEKSAISRFDDSGRYETLANPAGQAESVVVH